jgi:simple sugar transport system substrate-binding protein
MVPHRRRWIAFSLFLGVSLILAACAQTPTPAPATATAPAAPQPTPTPAPAQPTATPTAAPKEIIFGMLLVGPYNDRGWSQAHYEAGKYVEQKLPGAKMLYIDKVNPADRPGTTAFQLAEELVAKGAKVIIFNSDDHKDEAIKFAKAHPDIVVIHASGMTPGRRGRTTRASPTWPT